MIIDIIEIRERLKKNYGNESADSIGYIIESNKIAFNEHKIQLDLLGFQISYLNFLQKEKRYTERKMVKKMVKKS